MAELAATSESSSSTSSNPALAIIVFVHGFKGDDKTFLDYPQRLQHSLSTTFGPSSEVHALVYPAFETRGELSQCVENFGSWLTTNVAEIEMARAAARDDGQKDIARVVLVGHSQNAPPVSMGGLVIADCARSVCKGYTKAGERARMWPKIVGIMAFDTPYLGVHPSTFKNSATEAWGYLQDAKAVAASVGVGWSLLGGGKQSNANGAKASASSSKQVTSTASKGKGKAKATEQSEETDITRTLSNAGNAAASMAASKNSWAKYGYAAAGASALAVAAGTAWYSRQTIADTASNSQLWVTSHLEFVGVLWKPSVLRERLEEVLELTDDCDVQFHCFYTLLRNDGRTFIILPNESTLPGAYVQAESHFSSNKNNNVKNEIEAHCSMFDISTNDGAFTLGQQSALMIARWMRMDGRKE